MKGPHFFEKRKKEMARQQKAKEKADRKAQRKAGKGQGEGGEEGEFLDAEGLGAAEGAGEADEGTETVSDDGHLPAVEEGRPGPSAADHAAPATGALRGTARG